MINEEPTFCFNTTIYRKETFTGLMSNWHSFVPFSYKKASITSMVQQAITICSTYALLADELNEIRNICQVTDYPIDFVNTRIGIGLSKYLKTTKDEPELPVAGCNKRRMYVEIPYIGNQTELLKKKISHLTSETRLDLDLRYVAKPPHSIKSLFPTIEPVPKHLQSDMVHAAKCNDYGDTYVGKPKDNSVDVYVNMVHRRLTSINNQMTNVIITPLLTSTNKRRSSPNTRRTTKCVEAKQPAKPTPRRSSRIRDKSTAAVVNNITNQGTDQQIE